MLRTTFAAAAVAIFGAHAAAAETWDMPTPYPDAQFHTQNIRQFAADVAAATNGGLEIRLHPAGSLFKHPEIKNAVRGGQAPIGEFLMSLIANENPAFGADAQPFLATNYDEAWKLWQAQKPVVTALLERQNLVPLYAVPWPPQSLYTNAPVEKLSDLSGVKLRAYNAALEDFARRAGMTGTQVEVPDIPQAFATGRVEAMITSSSTGVTSAAWDYVKVYTDIQAWLPKNVIVVNKRLFDALPEATRAAVLAAAAAAEARGWEMSRAETATMTAKLAENGIAINQPTEALMADLKAIGAAMMEDWKAKAGADGAAILAAYGR